MATVKNIISEIEQREKQLESEQQRTSDLEAKLEDAKAAMQAALTAGNEAAYHKAADSVRFYEAGLNANICDKLLTPKQFEEYVDCINGELEDRCRVRAKQVREMLLKIRKMDDDTRAEVDEARILKSRIYHVSAGNTSMGGDPVYSTPMGLRNPINDALDIVSKFLGIIE